MPTVERPTTVARLDAGAVEYRLERRGEVAVVVLHGGHMRAGLALGEEIFAECGHSVLVPSRPGYGRTSPATGATPAAFADVVRDLCGHLGIERVAAVVGVSAGGRTAVSMAARHPDLVERLILQSALGFLPWPDRRTRLAANIAFTPATERATWGAVHALLRLAPGLGLRMMLGDLSTRPAREVLAALTPGDRATLIALFSLMRSGHGFRNDLRASAEETAQVTQPALVVATRNDGAVPFAHAESLMARLSRAELVESRAGSHFIWFADDYPAIADRIRDFLTSEPSHHG
ncbi:alpha/beta fold hydrolase [Streptosporangium sp. NPDC001681]|uniref:alpha/beta fold hydrolase n=1 Tax=Streptosporangium sp. NPDC001681 TaxID=3154395 RepID=UPI0033212C69